MNIEFSHIFEYLSHCSDSKQVMLDDNITTPIVVDTIVDNRPTQIDKTYNIFIQTIKNQSNNSQNIQLQNIITRLEHLKNKHIPLTAGIIRHLYKQTIVSQLTGIRKIAASAHSHDRIVLKDDKFTIVNTKKLTSAARAQNRTTLKAYKNELIEEWGKKRLERALHRYKINLHEMILQGKNLTAKHVNNITLALADYYNDDLDNCCKKIFKICHGEKPIQCLPLRAQRVFRKLSSHDPAHSNNTLSDIQSIFLNTARTDKFENLSPAQQNVIRQAVFINDKELELMFQGERVEGVVSSEYPFISCDFVHKPHIADKERLQVYQKIINSSKTIPEDQLEIFYDEILAKAVVKKEMTKGMCIPTPWKEADSAQSKWYTVKTRMLTGRGKLAYYLENESLKDRLVYRSTACSPSSLDSFTTVITDINPFAPPGYKWRRVGEEAERQILFRNTNKPLRVTGHSLGGSQTQLFLMNRIEKKGTFINDLPDRDIEIVTFDSPLLARKTARDFSYWLDQPENSSMAKRISVEHYIGNKDAVHLVGEAPLGWKADTSKLKKFKFVKLYPNNFSHPEMDHHPHNRRYYSTCLNKDFIEETINPDTYFSGKWSFIEKIRRLIGIIFYHIILVLGFLKRQIFGWRGTMKEVIKILKDPFNTTPAPPPKLLFI